MGSAGGTRLTETGLSLGTPYYMSPEQATGDQEVGPATDIYALAAVLYEILTGDPPYLGSTAQAVLGKIIQGAPVSATEIRKSIPTNVDAAITKALEKLPEHRFESAGELATALGDESFAYQAQSVATSVADPLPTRPTRSGNPLAWVVAGLATLIAVLALLFRLAPSQPTGFSPGDRVESYTLYIVLNWDPKLSDLDDLFGQVSADDGPTREQLRNAYVSNQDKEAAVLQAISTGLDSLLFVNRYDVFERTVFANIEVGRTTGAVRDLQTALRDVQTPDFSFTIVYAPEDQSVANSTDVNDDRLDKLSNSGGD